MLQRIFGLVCLFLVFLTNEALGQSSISVYPSTVYRGTTTNFLVAGVNTTFSTASGARIIPNVVGTNNLMISSNTLMNVSLPIPLNTPNGPYQFELQSWFWPWLNSNITIVDPPNNKGLIEGKVARGPNATCFYNSGMANQVIKFTPGPYYAYTDNNGNYSAWLPVGTYSVNLNSVPNNHVQICPSSPYSYTITAPGQTFANANFYLQQQPVVDLEVNMMTNIHRPGFTTTNYVRVENLGLATGMNVVVKAKVDPNVTYVSSNPPATFANDTLTWTIPGVFANTSDILYFDVVTPINALGWNMYYSASAATTSNDVDLTNNFDDVVTGVVGSYDPNDKQVWTQDNVVADGPINPTDSLLRYLVRFQNTGTDTAFNIFIRDTLDVNLDPTTLQVTGASHAYSYTINNGNQVEFFFPNILLEDSTSNEPASHGEIEFTIKRLPVLPLGTEIDNTAHIYFDFNLPVVTNTVTSKICPPITLDFSTTMNLQSLTIANNSTGSWNSILWEFGDGNSSTALSPSHAYSMFGTYNVCLTVTDTCGVRTLCKLVTATCIAPTASYVSSANQLSVNFSNQSSSSSSWFWDFGDANSSTLQNPSHNYAQPGTYQVCLTATDTCTSTTWCDSVTVTCPAPQTVYTTLINNLQVSFNNQSTGQGTLGYLWSFGDFSPNGFTMNPTHTYVAPGTYLVCLTTTDVCSSTTWCDSVTVTCPAPQTSFTASSTNLYASFSNQSTGQGTLGYLWDFGDGSGSSTSANPTYAYATPGNYQVCLITTDVCGSVTFCDSILIACAPPTADFGFNATGTQVQFIDQSTDSIVSWSWDFGDGSFSASASPMHSYAASGSYSACLVVTNTCGAMDTACETLTVVGIEDGPFQSVDLYPNPNDGRFSLRAEFGETGQLRAQIRDLAGRLLYEENWGEVQGQFTKNMEMNLPAGSYFLQLELNGRQVNRMFSIR